MLSEYCRTKWVAWTFVALVSVISLLVGFNLGAKSTQDVGPVGTTVSLRFGASGSNLTVPLLGEIRAKTHAFPLRVNVSATELSLERVLKWVNSSESSDKLARNAMSQLKNGIFWAAIWGILWTVMIALALTLLITGSRKLALMSALLAISLAFTALGSVAATYKTSAIREATYTGSLAKGREIVGILQVRANNVDSLRKGVQSAVKTMANYYNAPQSLDGEDLAGTYRVLAVSDLHLDPIGFELATNLAKEFKATAVVDAGDVTNYGTSIEANAVSKMFSPFRPYYFIPGNHDSPITVSAIKTLKGVKVLEHTLVTENGISIYGVEDPRSKIYNISPADKDAAQVGKDAVPQFLAIAAKEGTPTIVVTHSPAMGDAFVGIVSVIVEGHTHEALITQDRGTWRINVGTTGGVKATPSKNYPHYPHTAAVLYFSAEMPRRLVAIDQIEVSAIENQTSITRRVISPSLAGTSSP